MINTNMSNIFHLAIEGGNLDITVPFYTDVLSLPLGKDGEKGKYQDIDFWGNELTLHQSEPRTNKNHLEDHKVDMGIVPVPHLGIHLESNEWIGLSHEISENFLECILIKPFVRYRNTPTEQWTMFIQDPNYNVLEIKTLVNDK